MLNDVTLIGAVAELPKEMVMPNGDKQISMIMKVERPYRDSSGIYQSDHFVVHLWRGIADKTKDICQMGDILSIQGRLISYDGSDEPSAAVIAEQVTFLSSRILHLHEKRQKAMRQQKETL